MNEILDLKLAETLPAGELLDRLRDHAPEGLEFLKVTLVPPGSKKLSGTLQAAEYVVRLEPAHLDRAGAGDKDLETALVRFLEAPEVQWTVMRKRTQKQADIRPAVDEAAWRTGAGVPPVLAGSDLARYLFVRVLLNREGHAKPEEVAGAILGGDPGLAPHDVFRLGFVTGAGAPSRSIPAPV